MKSKIIKTVLGYEVSEELFRNAVAELPANIHSAFHAYYYEQKKMRAISIEAGVSLATICNRLDRARLSLKRKLNTVIQSQ